MHSGGGLANVRPRSIGPVILKIIITVVRFVGAQETANVLNMTSPSNKYRRKYVICFANVLLHSLVQHSPSHLDCNALILRFGGRFAKLFALCLPVSTIGGKTKNCNCFSVLFFHSSLNLKHTQDILPAMEWTCYHHPPPRPLVYLSLIVIFTI